MKVMNKVNEVIATLPAEDLDRAKRWYADKFGLQPTMERPDGAIYEIGGGHLMVYPSSYAGTNRATSATLHVDDVRGIAEDLRGAGVQFERFDMPNTSWHGDVATVTTDGQEYTGAWFRDSEGNVVALASFPMR